MMKGSLAMNYLLVLVFLCVGGLADDIKVITPDKVKEFEDKKVTVEMEMQSSHFSKSKTTFLNSEKDFKSEKNFAVIIFESDLERFTAMKIESPAEHYKSKTI